jgi:plasmid stability protein
MVHIQEINDLLQGVKKMNRSPADKTTMRLPDDVVSYLKRRAAHNVSSMTCEAVRAIRSQMAQERRAKRAEVAVD